nr:PREDICTED: transmembrane protein 205 isoform X3 [Anolis carolinensis]|eukprot:XP_016846640.1 PREDICTED: transmembrane protein 205 isoform X3 [Anolis carolinensis]
MWTIWKRQHRRSPVSLTTKMVTEGEPSVLIKLLQLFVLSTAWGMQIWVTFIAGFVLFQGIVLFFACLILTLANASWFSHITTKTMFKMQEIEKEHGLGAEVGLSGKEDYQRLKEKDAKYRSLRQKFFKFHGLSSLCNLACVICTGVNLAFIALHLDSL